MRGLTRIGAGIDEDHAPRRLVGSYITASQSSGAVLDADWQVGERRIEAPPEPEAAAGPDAAAEPDDAAEPEAVITQPEPAAERVVELEPEPEPVEIACWEYLIVPLKDVVDGKKKARELAAERLNELGAQGWEAVGMSLKQGARSARPVVLLKRAASS